MGVGRPKGPVDNLVCPQCEKKFSAPTYEYRKFCCHACSVAFNRDSNVAFLSSIKHLFGRKKIPRKILTCPTCGKEFEIRITEFQIYCSNGCRRHTEEWKRNHAKRMVGRTMSNDFKEMRRRAWSGNKNPMNDLEIRERSSASRLGKSLKELGHQDNCVCTYCRAKRGELFDDSEFVRKMRRKSFPNKPETALLELLDKHFPDQWGFVGDGSLIVAGKNPDFVHKTEKRLIELFGDYWHSEQVTGIPEEEHEQERIPLLENEGYQTLVVWEHDLEDEEKLMERIREWAQ